MLLADLLGWWYVRGWSWAAQQLFVVRTQKILHFFSISDLLKTLFAPFRQDAVDTKQAPLGVKLQAFGGNIISRIFGAMIRGTIVVIGILLVVLNFIFSFVAVLGWGLLPLAPVLAVILFLQGLSV